LQNNKYPFFANLKALLAPEILSERIGNLLLCKNQQS
jgi:hypothetical protein